MIESENIDTFCFIPVNAGKWFHHELFDGTYTITDLFDIVEAINIYAENKSMIEEHAKKAAEREAKTNAGKF